MAPGQSPTSPISRGGTRSGAAAGGRLTGAAASGHASTASGSTGTAADPGPSGLAHTGISTWAQVGAGLLALLLGFALVVMSRLPVAGGRPVR